MTKSTKQILIEAKALIDAPEKWGKGASGPSITRELAALRAALNCAVQEQWVKSFTPFKVPSSKSRRTRFLTRDEFDRLINASNTITMRVFLEIAIRTASRSNKIYQLKWSDIDPHSRTIYFAEGTKNKRTRPMPINNKLSWVLGVAYMFKSGEYVLESNGKPIKSIRKQFEKTAERAGLVDVQIHDLRRSAASWMLQDGVDIEVVADILSDTVEIVKRHYGHFSQGNIREALNKL